MNPVSEAARSLKSSGIGLSSKADINHLNEYLLSQFTFNVVPYSDITIQQICNAIKVKRDITGIYYFEKDDHGRKRLVIEVKRTQEALEALKPELLGTSDTWRKGEESTIWTSIKTGKHSYSLGVTIAHELTFSQFESCIDKSSLWDIEKNPTDWLAHWEEVIHGKEIDPKRSFSCRVIKGVYQEDFLNYFKRLLVRTYPTKAALFGMQICAALLEIRPTVEVNRLWKLVIKQLSDYKIHFSFLLDSQKFTFAELVALYKVLWKFTLTVNPHPENRILNISRQLNRIDLSQLQNLAQSEKEKDTREFLKLLIDSFFANIWPQMPLYSVRVKITNAYSPATLPCVIKKWICQEIIQHYLSISTKGFYYLTIEELSDYLITHCQKDKDKLPHNISKVARELALKFQNRIKNLPEENDPVFQRTVFPLMFLLKPLDTFDFLLFLIRYGRIPITSTASIRKPLILNAFKKVRQLQVHEFRFLGYRWELASNIQDENFREKILKMTPLLIKRIKKISPEIVNQFKNSYIEVTRIVQEDPSAWIPNLYNVLHRRKPFQEELKSFQKFPTLSQLALRQLRKTSPELAKQFQPSYFNSSFFLPGSAATQWPELVDAEKMNTEQDGNEFKVNRFFETAYIFHLEESALGQTLLYLVFIFNNSDANERQILIFFEKLTQFKYFDLFSNPVDHIIFIRSLLKLFRTALMKVTDASKLVEHACNVFMSVFCKHSLSKNILAKEWQELINFNFILIKHSRLEKKNYFSEWLIRITPYIFDLTFDPSLMDYWHEWLQILQKENASSECILSLDYKSQGCIFHERKGYEDVEIDSFTTALLNFSQLSELEKKILKKRLTLWVGDREACLKVALLWNWALIFGCIDLSTWKSGLSNIFQRCYEKKEFRILLDIFQIFQFETVTEIVKTHISELLKKYSADSTSDHLEIELFSYLLKNDSNYSLENTKKILTMTIQQGSKVQVESIFDLLCYDQLPGIVRFEALWHTFWGEILEKSFTFLRPKLFYLISVDPAWKALRCQEYITNYEELLKILFQGCEKEEFSIIWNFFYDKEGKERLTFSKNTNDLILETFIKKIDFVEESQLSLFILYFSANYTLFSNEENTKRLKRIVSATRNKKWYDSVIGSLHHYFEQSFESCPKLWDLKKLKFFNKTLFKTDLEHTRKAVWYLLVRSMWMSEVNKFKNSLSEQDNKNLVKNYIMSLNFSEIKSYLGEFLNLKKGAINYHISILIYLLFQGIFKIEASDPEISSEEIASCISLYKELIGLKENNNSFCLPHIDTCKETFINFGQLSPSLFLSNDTKKQSLANDVHSLYLMIYTSALMAKKECEWILLPLLKNYQEQITKLSILPPRFFTMVGTTLSKVIERRNLLNSKQLSNLFSNICSFFENLVPEGSEEYLQFIKFCETLFSAYSINGFDLSDYDVLTNVLKLYFHFNTLKMNNPEPKLLVPIILQFEYLLKRGLDIPNNPTESQSITARYCYYSYCKMAKSYSDRIHAQKPEESIHNYFVAVSTIIENKDYAFWFSQVLEKPLVGHALETIVKVDKSPEAMADHGLVLLKKLLQQIKNRDGASHLSCEQWEVLTTYLTPAFTTLSKITPINKLALVLDLREQFDRLAR